MSFVVAILTFLLVINCFLLILLVLVQLPKKDAGAGMAFGGGTADALFGSGSGNALTKITKWTAGIFLGMALVLGWLQGTVTSNNTASDFTKLVEQKQQQVAVPPPSSAPQPKPQAAPPASSLLSTIPMSMTNSAVPSATNPAPAK
jgi:protein translocase SecG subunit